MTSAEFVRSARVNLGTTISVLLIWPALVLMWPELESTAGNALPLDDRDQGTTFVLVRNDGDRASWSPVLIPLPSPDAWSGALENREADSDALTIIRRDPAVMLDRQMDAGPDRRGVPTGQTDDIMTSVFAYDPIPVELPVFQRDDAAAPAGVMLEVADGLKGRAFALGELPDDIWPVRETEWSADASVVLDSDGRVQHVLLARRTDDSDVNAAVIRSLYRGRADDGKGGGVGRIRVTWFPSAPAAESP